MKKVDLRLPDYLNHIAQAIERIKTYTKGIDKALLILRNDFNPAGSCLFKKRHPNILAGLIIPEEAPCKMRRFIRHTVVQHFIIPEIAVPGCH